ncbi:hypothetical protein DCAR_0832334 [Daucus carota subsp. sativus]|uniref:XS domain-containing protein n=1 Tax=Daucus carota subsp. sativus TaxID=79200 RepID=A0A175YQF5_DAUCS|nr:PREDICTED: uncharacterized protein LOC108199865 [Daucus carota subsp. sativus]WOH12825.1 hypothetical protein DCAR_0832334 [Daucus carota subsp. sativus]
MAGGNSSSNYTKHQSNKPSSSSSSSHKSRWESGPTKPPPNRNQNLPAAANSRNLPPPPPLKPKSTSNNNPLPKPSPQNPSPSGPPFDNHGPPPSYGFHMLDRRSIGLADGSVRSYFALPLNYQDFAPQLAPPRFLGNEGNVGKQFPMSPDFRDSRNKNQEYWNSLGREGGSLKRKFVDEGDERDGLARQRQQLLQYGNAGLNSGGGPSNVYGREEEFRGGKFMRGEEGGRNGGRSKFSEADQAALKKAFLHFVKLINEDSGLRKRCLADGKQGRIGCMACRRSTKDFPDMHGLIMHTYNPDNAELLVDHLGLHKALCILMGWNHQIPPDNSKQYHLLSADEAAANQDDLIMWPPHVIIQNTMTGKGRDGRVEGLGNRAMDTKLRDLGFTSGKAKSLYGKQGHLGVTLVKFAGDQSGLKEATRLGEFFEKDNHGRRSWAGMENLVSSKSAENNPNLVKVDKNTGEKEKILFGYLATASDFDKIDQDTKTRVEIVSKRDY